VAAPGLPASSPRGRSAAPGGFAAFFRIGKNHQHVGERRRWSISRPADVETGILGPELVLELKIPSLLKMRAACNPRRHFADRGSSSAQASI